MHVSEFMKMINLAMKEKTKYSLKATNITLKE